MWLDDGGHPWPDMTVDARNEAAATQLEKLKFRLNTFLQTRDNNKWPLLFLALFDNEFLNNLNPVFPGEIFT
ncbi:hypothetical protein [Cedecea davisae]|uniref:Uncharacterized protein n=1 Tax=Cedecea davisae DSM 4568 TaxID=566551 RepID=S3IIF7_9ENTR|nr:hypothetical protein [Cedecea davisae]EPF12860.1 hypothetical protein HMPREF0201_04463 [Cedecea davisae DSM 4568]